MTHLTHGELFAGIGGFAVGAAAHGIHTEWHVEIDKNCQTVLHRHFPDADQFSDVVECGAHNLKPVDIITFGSPCQDLSVAGKREGLKGERSGLFFEAVRIINELSPKWAIWENVPGALSSHKGADFQAVLSALLDASIPMPRSGRWANAGMVRSGQVEVAWRILDAQYFGVAQRRRRLFAVVGFGGRSAAEVLFEREGVRWHTAPSRKTWKGTPGDAPTSTLRGFGHGWQGQHNDTNAVIVAHETGQGYWQEGDVSGTLRCEGENRPSRPSNVIATGWDSQRARIHDVNGVSPTLQRGAKTSGNQIPAIAFAQNVREEVRNLDDLAGSLNTEPGMHQQTFVAFDGRNLTEGDVAHTMQSKKSGGYSLNYSPMVFGGNNTSGEIDVATCCNAHGGSGRMDFESETFVVNEKQEQEIFWQNRSQSGEARIQEHTSPTVSNMWGTGGNNTLMVGVRRLTPVECEKLQGFTPGHTDGQSDSTRYRQLGNAVAVPVVAWILGRIARAE